MVIDRDCGDECDHDASIARMAAFIEKTMAEMLKPMLATPEPRDRVHLVLPLKFIEVTFIIGDGIDASDPGDEHVERTRFW